MAQTKKIVLILAIAIPSGLIGGIAGYVVNDLTERENPVVAAEIADERAHQENLDDFFDELAAGRDDESTP